MVNKLISYSLNTLSLYKSEIDYNGMLDSIYNSIKDYRKVAADAVKYDLLMFIKDSGIKLKEDTITIPLPGLTLSEKRSFDTIEELENHLNKTIEEVKLFEKELSNNFRNIIKESTSKQRKVK